MRLESLMLSGFRNLLSQQIFFENQITQLVGRNGQGKTSVLEAIFLLSHARSFRTSKVRELIQRDSLLDYEPAVGTESKVLGEISHVFGRTELMCELQGASRKLYVHGKRVTDAADYYGQLRTVVFTPDDLDLIKGAPLIRRQFLDRNLTMLVPSYVRHLLEYQKALKSRNKVLKELEGKINSALLSVWEEILIRAGMNIAQHRARLTASLEAFATTHYQRLAQGNSGERLRLSFKSQFMAEGKPRSSAELFEEFEKTRLRDVKAKNTNLGVHRDDVEILLQVGHGERRAAEIASQGQMRSMSLALKLAAVELIFQETSDLPLLLLDDVESELDQTRRAALYEILSGFKAQVIITGTEPSAELAAQSIDSTIRQVQAGKIL